jgi:glutaconate CoA-transferase subunit A
LLSRLFPIIEEVVISVSKVMTMKEAISRYVHSDDLLFLGGAQHGEPAAATYEIIRQRIDHLTVVSALMNSVSLMIGEGLVDKMITGYSPQDDKRSFALVKARETDRYPVYEESSHFGIASALFAGYVGIPFMPTHCLLGSDMMKYNDNIKSITDPFSGGSIGVVKAINPDVGIIHVQRCDAGGNAHRWGSLGVDMEGINASKTVIVTTEKIVDSDIIRRDPNRTIIPGFRVSAVVEQPWGSHPMHLAGCYNGDMFGMMMELSNKEGYENFVNRYIYGVKDWNEYMALRRKDKGEEYFKNLEIKDPVYSEPVVHGY